MQAKRYFFSFSVLILLASQTNAQTNAVANSGPEIRNERSMYSKVFQKANGQHEAIFSSAPVHYKKEGAWEDINTTITPGNSGYQNESNVIQSYFPNSIDSSGKIKLIVNNTDQILIHSEKKMVFLNEQHDLLILGIPADHSIAKITTNSITYPEIFTGISDSYSILNGELKNNIVLNSRPALVNNMSSGYFGFQEIAELPAGWKIIPAIPSTDNSANALISSSLQILDANGIPVLTIPAPVFFDQYGLESDGANPVEGKYLVKQENNFWTITTLAPVAWLKDANTNYPVSIDPTVVIAGTTGGWQSPNNWVDNPSFVFLGVCCSNLTHRAWIKFNTSGIPATSCITDVELQVNVTTAIAGAELVWIDDVTGAFGPYGGIVPAAYNDFGTGPYTSFTINGTGLYGYYVLGSSACSLLQTQLPGGWFQVAFMLSNEPSTNYKIIDGTTSNLKVTYNAPPCVVLPIELLSFDATCNNGKVNLKWATASESNNDYFSVERTTDGIHYETAGTIPGAGNSSQTLQYSFVDAEPVNGTTYYRLKQTDFNGEFKYSNSVSVTCDAVPGFTITPNPNSGTFSIEGAQTNSDVLITDVLGQKVFQTKITGTKTEIDLSDHLNGIYFVQVISGRGIVSKKIIIDK